MWSGLIGETAGGGTGGNGHPSVLPGRRQDPREGWAMVTDSGNEGADWDSSGADLTIRKSVVMN